MITALPGILCAVLLLDRPFGRDLGLIALPVIALVTSVTQYAIWESSAERIDWPLLIAFAAVLVAAIAQIVATKNFGSEWKSALACTFYFLLGFALYLYLPIISTTNPPVNWAYSRTLDGFLHLMRRGQFEHVNPISNPAIFAAEVWRMIIQTGRGLGWLYVVFAALPFCLISKLSGITRRWLWALLLISICVGPLLTALLNVPSDRQSQEVVEMYFFPLRVPFAIWTGMGLMLFATYVAMRGRHPEVGVTG
jgi:hypothetical protein